MLILGQPPSTSRRFVGTGVAPGTCGELVQGFTSEGRPFHVTCPIEKSSTVKVDIRPSERLIIHRADGKAAQDKIRLSVQKTVELLDLEPAEVKVAHWTDLDVGKGMGSSTADVVAAARAVAAAVEKTLTPRQLAKIATSIESSDGSMYPGLVAVNHKNGDMIEQFAWWPQFIVVMIVPARMFNTESANFTGKDRHGDEFDAILSSLAEASGKQEAAAFAHAATRSAALNQRFVPNAYHALLEDRLSEFGADGINVAHTGTITGLLFSASKPEAHKAAAAACIELQEMFRDARVEMSITPPSPTEAG